MDVIILIFFVLLIATLLLGIWQIKNPKLKTADDLSDDLCLYCPLDDDEKGTPGVINKYAPGEFYAVTESDIWLMRYHKNILFAVNCKTTRKNKFEIKVFIFGN